MFCLEKEIFVLLAKTSDFSQHCTVLEKKMSNLEKAKLLEISSYQGAKNASNSSF